MIHFNAVIMKFGMQGEKTGWSYIEVPAKLSSQLKPGYRKAFRVKGWLDQHPIEGVSLIPMGNGDYIMALNAAMRKALGKRKGAHIEVKIEVDGRPIKINTTFLECLKDDPSAWAFFHSLPQGHRNYFSKWIDSAKTDGTREKRIARAVNALSRNWGYSEMIRFGKKDSLL
jgi:hypothetical protein